MKASEITKDTPIAMLTVGQLQEVLGLSAERKQDPVREDKPREYVYGLAGIRKLFSVSHPTAQRYKDTIIAGAVRQNGRTIIVDVDKALELFDQHKKKSK